MDTKLGIKPEVTIKKENIMAKLEVSEFVKDVEKCLEECKQAVLQCLATYQKTTENVFSMSKEEEKAFLQESLIFIYNKADKSFDMPEIVDAVVKSIAIPQGVELIFKKVA